MKPCKNAESRIKVTRAYLMGASSIRQVGLRIMLYPSIESSLVNLNSQLTSANDDEVLAMAA